MEAVVFLVALVLLCLLAPLIGEDSRTRDRRGWWPGRRRQPETPMPPDTPASGPYYSS